MTSVYTFIKFGYVVVVVTMMLMIWASLAGARETDNTNFPPCFFNPLCSCSKAVPDLGIVQCRDVPLPRIPQPLNTSKVFRLHLENNGLKWLEPYFLQATGLYRLEISHNPLGEIPDEAFMGLERSLWELHLINDQLIEVPTRALRHLQKLRLLNLSDNEITHLEPDDWRGLENSLQMLILSENSISKLPSDAFSGLPLLETIDLRGNNLKTIDPNVFRDGLGYLSRVFLGDNQLTQIPYVALAPLKLLRYLDLSKNHIRSVRKDESNESIPTLSLDTIRLDYNMIQYLPPGAFQYFNILNSTFLDGNPITYMQENAFRNAKIRELSLRNCKLSQILPAAFDGLESSLHTLDLSGNNITGVTKEAFSRFDQLQSLSLRDNLILMLNPTEVFVRSQFTLLNLDLSGVDNIATALQDLRRIRNLRSLTLTRLSQNHIAPEDFMEFGSNLEELRIVGGFVKTIKNHAFNHVQGLKLIDFSDNSISSIENDCFHEIGHSLVTLKMAHAFSSSVQALPSEAFRPLINLQHLDLGNNYFKSMSDTSFHFLKNLRRLELQDNRIERVHKGTFQGDIHGVLEDVFLSFNEIRNIQQHTFVDLASLQNLFLDDNKIESINRRAFMNLDRLDQLILRGNKISVISDEAFQNLPELDLLDLAYNKLDNFDFGMFDQVGTLSSFKVNVSHNKIQELQTNVTGFGVGREGNMYFLGVGLHSNIKILDLSFNNISQVGRAFFRPAEISLTHLHLSHNALVNVTRDVFGSMPHLQWLDLSSNSIEQLDFDSFRNTKKLQVFLISNNNLEGIVSETFQSLSGIRVVDLSHNKLRSLPDHLFPEEGLETLDVSNNQLTILPLSSLSTAAATTLCELDVSGNNIGSIAHPELLSRFRSLVSLDISNNRILRIDDSVFVSLPRLMHLDVSHNINLDLAAEGFSFRGLEHTLLKLELNNVSLTSVPELPLLRLRSLSIAGNELPTVPPELASNMTSLRYLDLSYNDLTAVPLVTHSLPQLRILSLAGNPITTLTNTSLLGVAEQLEELDIRQIALATLEMGALCKMDSLRTLHLSVRRNVPNFNIPKLLQSTDGLRHLHVEVNEETNLAKEMNGILPKKLRNITFSGSELRTLSDQILEGNQSPELHIALRQTSIPGLSSILFQHVGSAQNISLDLRNSGNLQQVGNPNTGTRPALHRHTFLTNLQISGNALNCDCKIGWVEVWERKKRQYMCNEGAMLETKCRQASDDLRNTFCANKGNQTLIEVLKMDIECGWGSAEPSHAFTAVGLLAFVTLLQVF